MPGRSRPPASPSEIPCNPRLVRTQPEDRDGIPPRLHGRDRRLGGVRRDPLPGARDGSRSPRARSESARRRAASGRGPRARQGGIRSRAGARRRGTTKDGSRRRSIDSPRRRREGRGGGCRVAGCRPRGRSASEAEARARQLRRSRISSAFPLEGSDALGPDPLSSRDVSTCGELPRRPTFRSARRALVRSDRYQLPARAFARPASRRPSTWKKELGPDAEETSP